MINHNLKNWFIVRTLFSLVVLINTVILYLDKDIFFCYNWQREINNFASTIFGYFSITSCSYVPFLITILSSLLLMFGVLPRLSSLIIFISISFFQNTNPIILDGQDILMRLFAFFLIFQPKLKKIKDDTFINNIPKKLDFIWLFRFQIILIYISSSIQKIRSVDWLSGDALIYISQLDDLFFSEYAYIFSSNFLLSRILTYFVLLVEIALPLLLILKSTRNKGVLLGIALHLSINFFMNLFLFQYLMIIGLLSFFKFKSKA